MREVPSPAPVGAPLGAALLTRVLHWTSGAKGTHNGCLYVRMEGVWSVKPVRIIEQDITLRGAQKAVVDSTRIKNS